jgi:hypothetical protein
VGLHNAKEKTMSKKPALIAYSVREREGQKAVWTRIGAAWPHGNGPGFNIQLEALPIGDRIVLTEPKAEEAEAKAE